jgi:hypothetical protein
MQAKLGRHEMLKFLANRPDQGTIRAQVLDVIRHCPTVFSERTQPRCVELRCPRAASRHRRVRSGLDARSRIAHSVNFP